MKKLTILTSILTWLAAASWAQGTASHFTLCDDALSGTSGMTVTAILDLSNTSIYWGNSYGRYQVGAFVEGECHAIAMEGESENMTYWNDRDQYGNWFVLKLKYSSARRSKPVRFKLYNDRTGIEYELKNDDNIRTIGVNYGLDTNPIVLKAVEVTNISFNDFEMTAGSSYDLGAKLTLTPSNGTIPSNLVWDISPSTYSLDDNGFGAYHFYPSAAGTYEVDVYNPGRSLYARSGIITVKRQPNYVSGLSINSGYETNEVPKGDASTLGDVLARALKVSYYYPNEAPDEYPEWESSNTSVVRQDATGTWMPVGKGSCTMTAKVYNKPGDASSGVRKSASLTIKVTNYVTNLNVLHYQLNCYVGDDLTDYLPRTVEIEPADADKPTFDYQPVRSSGILERRSDGHIVAIGEGNGMVQVTAKSDGGDVSVNISVMVQNAWNDVAVKQPTLSIKYTGAGSAQDITSAVKGNISYLPASATYFAGYGPTVTSSNPSVVSVENVPSATGVGSDLTATAHKAGTATITVTLESPNLLEESVANVGTAVAPKTVTRSFDVVIEPSVAGISLPGQLVVIMGQTLDLKTALTVEPQDAEFDYSKVRWSWNDEMKGYFEITNNVLTPKKPYRGSISLTATVEGSTLTAQTRLYILQPATALNVKSGFEKIEVFVGQSTELTDKLNEAFVVTPENSTDVLSYTIEKEDIVENERDATFYPKKQGTTKVTATLYDLLDSDSRKSPRFSKFVEVVVKVALQNFSFDQREYSLNVGQTLDLKKELRLSPADADIDLSQVVWTVEDNTKAKVDNGVLTALAPTAPDYFEVTATLGSIKASTIICIYSPATAINVNSGYENIEVYVGESEKLTDALKKAVTIVPANSTSSIWWEFADESIVGYDDMTEKYIPLKGGTTKATALAKGFNGNVKAEITVKVLVKGSSLSFEDRVYYMNVGEVKDFTNELNIYPADAVFDKSKLRLSAETQYKDYVQIDGLKVKALLPTAPKDFVLTATYEGTGLTATTDIRISSPATAINVNSGYETIEV
ncbi:MAG: Ig-like domain-containing protein, partial [Prevotella sp.]|nr:Ig-like domain-containing protein [Prevotella sp.]